MSKLIFDETGKKTYKTGVSNGVLFPIADDGKYGKGVALSGLINFNHSPEGGEANDYYADNIKYLTLRSAENFKASMTCYSTPEEFDECDGTKQLVPGVKIRGQARRSFGFAYLSKIGNDILQDDYGQILHLIYGCSVTPSEEDHATINESPEPQELSYEISSIPIPVTGFKPISCIEFDSTKLSPENWNKIIDITYGTDAQEAVYKLTTDTTIDSSKTYYTRSGSEGSYVYEEVQNPQVADIGTYYEMVSPAKEATDSKLLLPADVIAMFPEVAG